MATPPSTPVKASQTSPSSFRTPEHQVVRSVNGYARHYTLLERSPIFNGEVLPQSPGTAIDALAQRDGFAPSIYRTPSGKTLTVLQQKNTGTPCGMGCLMMLFMDRVLQSKDPRGIYKSQSNAQFSFIDQFYTNDSLTSAQDLARIASAFETGVSLSVIGFAIKDHPTNENVQERIQVASGKGIVQKLKAKLKEGKSIMQAITHPNLKGHWVIIDEFAKGHFYIRDPYSAKAYKVSDKELAPMLLKGIKVEYASQATFQ